MNQDEMILSPEDAVLLLKMLAEQCEYDPSCYPLFDRLRECAAMVKTDSEGEKE